MKPGPVILLLAVLIVLSGATYQVSEVDQVIVTQLVTPSAKL